MAEAQYEYRAPFPVLYSIVGEIHYPRRYSKYRYLPEKRSCKHLLSDRPSGSEYNSKGYGIEPHPSGKWLQSSFSGVLTETEFDTLVARIGCWATATPNLGTLGAPGFTPCLVPAIVFEQEGHGHDDDLLYFDMYVTPLPHEPMPQTGWTARHWALCWNHVMERYTPGWVEWTPMKERDQEAEVAP